jgi:NAD(P)-dependent dehydrogenase (short-subunit alcohol dehydrogenase family)
VSERPSPEPLKEFGASVPQLVPWKRFGKAEEVAPVIAFLASKPASYVTVAQYTMGGEWSVNRRLRRTSTERGTEGNER